MEGHRERTTPGGFTLVELLLGVVVFVIAAVVLGNHITTNYSTTAMQRDKVFAFTKAQAILAEIHALVDRGEVEAAIDLDVLDDGTTNQPTLAIARDASDVLILPDHPLSGNIRREANWVWSRRISVRPFAGLNNRNVRYVTVRILKRGEDGRAREMASLSSVVNSVGSSFPSSQVFDVYLLAIENIPGWWVFMEAIVPFVESAITDLENRNPGLNVRTHWITKSGFGRNQVYRPQLNEEVDSLQTIGAPYLYPALMPTGNASTYYYVPDLMKARISVDGVERNGWDSTLNPYPYALADFYNHAMRYPRALELHENRVAAIRDRETAIRDAHLLGVAPPEPLIDMSDEPPLQVLLERMISEPDRYRHALVVNLHGELLPMPPLRNYSDPAKLPSYQSFVRAVTHPEELRTQRPGIGGSATEDVRLRVYAYTTDPAGLPANGVMDSNHPILVEVLDVDLTDGTGMGVAAPGVRVESIAGGVLIGGDNQYYPPAPAYNYMVDSFTWPAMNYACWFMDRGPGHRKSTLFVLYNTPLQCPPVATKGLNLSERCRPYGLAYVPGPVEAARDFSRDLSAIGDGPKNTARWVVTIPGTIWDESRFITPDSVYYDPRTTTEPDVMLTVRTRIFDPYSAYPWWDDGHWPGGADGRVISPENLSETYAWWARSREAVPFTERAQIFGDPRHNPYRDTLAGDPDFGDGYNWFHDSLTNNSENALADHPGIVRANNLWNSGPRFDVPRLMSLFRNAIARSEAIYTTLSGYSYYYLGVGNEIGYDVDNGYPNSIPINLNPWGGGLTTPGFVNNITGNRCLVRAGGAGSAYWWGMPWLGELYPDSVWASQWMALDAGGRINGNLVAGTSTTTFYRGTEVSVYGGSDKQAYGTSMLSSRQILNTRGCVSFFNNGSTSGHFNHHFSSGDGTLVGPGIELSQNYGFPIPDTAYITRPFSVNTTGNDSPEFGIPPYSNTTERFHAAVLRTFYNHPSGHVGSGIVLFETPDRSSAAWIVVNGIAATASTGSSFLAKYSLLSMFQSYFELGSTALTHRIPQPPRLEIVAPTEISELIDPSTIDIRIMTEWLRWDRLPYTSTTPTTFSEDESLIDYAIYYSRDNGTNWLHIVDDTPATIGQKPEDPAHFFADAGVGDEIYSWSTPSVAFPEGGYLIRVEAYRSGMALHYSVHQTRIYIER